MPKKPHKTKFQRISGKYGCYLVPVIFILIMCLSILAFKISQYTVFSTVKTILWSSLIGVFYYLIFYFKKPPKLNLSKNILGAVGLFYVLGHTTLGLFFYANIWKIESPVMRCEVDVNEVWKTFKQGHITAEIEFNNCVMSMPVNDRNIQEAKNMRTMGIYVIKGRFGLYYIKDWSTR